MLRIIIHVRKGGSPNSESVQLVAPEACMLRFISQPAATALALRQATFERMIVATTEDMYSISRTHAFGGRRGIAMAGFAGDIFPRHAQEGG